MSRRQTLVQLNDEQIRQLDRAARRGKTSRSEIVRRAIDRYLQIEEVDAMEKRWVEGLRRSSPDRDLDAWSAFWSEWAVRSLEADQPW